METSAKLKSIQEQKKFGVLGTGICALIAIPIAMIDFLQQGDEEPRENWKLCAIILVSSPLGLKPLPEHADTKNRGLLVSHGFPYHS
jgi:hypothetical protein